MLINSNCGSRTAVGVLSLACPRESRQREGHPGWRKTLACAPRVWGPRRATVRPCTVSRERASKPAPLTGSPQTLAVLEARHTGTPNNSTHLELIHPLAAIDRRNTGRF